MCVAFICELQHMGFLFKYFIKTLVKPNGDATAFVHRSENLSARYIAHCANAKSYVQNDRPTRNAF